jgi:conjugative transposon TraM protein
MLIQHPETLKQRKAIKDTASFPAAISAIPVSVTAVVHSTQILTSGSTIKFRLTEDMKIKDRVIPKGAFLFGVCTISNERLTAQVNNVAYLNQVSPVSLSVYDIDGIEGIYVPGAVSREVIKEGTDQAIQSFNPGSYDPSLTGQVASAGLQATKALLSRKVKMIRVTVKAGHRILLQNSHAG